MNNRLLTLAGTLALLAVLGTQYAKPLMAQVRATLVKDINDVSQQPYYAMIGKYPPGTNTPTPRTVTVPAGKRLVLDMAVLLVTETASRGVNLVFQSNGVNTTLPFRVPVGNCGDDNGLTRCSSVERLSFVLEPGTVIGADLFSESASPVQVIRLSGHLVDYP